ncbi:Nramp family divalent metal transporter [Polaribacter dokdonensis]|uniref:Mn2+ and Fe2+ transporter of the NRAMP family n=1 Tax=Polaribacter dokdonensis DSW-5 TaxID=1300348 RepID=A0A0N0UNA1_9FLAO|nr:Nramp family divalent metal transporter [Polaribacter dokdonensis]KOY51037.1 Mn2+ and Fe2+ transporter of the NRAMP family [Polaribacter dokdonensis DSW-5]SEE20157.1 NRAMP (natural resistance-associated macrophage protein) metal ion transporters [Polaribacter dokdonensis DSW-5]
MIKKWFQNIGPGTLVAAAFIGPGTVTLCTTAGVNFGFNLLWAMLLSIIATIVLQEMAARLGIIAQKGLSEVIREEIKVPFLKQFITLLILSAIVIGNASYEAGNISGGILGLETILGEISYNIGELSINFLSIAIGIIAFVLLYIGNYKFLEKALVTLVILMSFSFVVTAIITQPNIGEVLNGLLVPKFPEKSLLTIIGLIGTTVVPYNLFLHASLVKERWSQKEDLKLAKKDTIVSIILGGLVSIAIIISAASIPSKDILNAADLAKGLAPLYGEFAKYFLALGLFAAGITSAITAPLAAAYVAKGCLGFKGGLQSKWFRLVWMIILFLGVLFSSIGIKPIEIIKFAQIANGMLLPIIAGILLWIMNKKNVLGIHVNSKTQNVFGFIILLVSIFLGAKGILKVFNFI